MNLILYICTIICVIKAYEGFENTDTRAKSEFKILTGFELVWRNHDSIHNTMQDKHRTMLKLEKI